MMSRSQRKVEHIRHALQAGQSGRNGLDDVSFIPNSLPNISYGNTRIETELLHFRLHSPIVINAMTGGAAATKEINQRLAIVAREKRLVMAVGSQMAALRDPSVRDSYSIVRRENPDGIIFANLGAEATTEQAREAVEMIEADALQIHVNVMQELMMPEGDRDFTGYLERIGEIVEKIDVPVIVKEVGFGMSRESIRRLIDAGVKAIDLGGSGGTNFARVENLRSSEPLSMFEDWGLTTAQSLLEAGEYQMKGVSMIATGGIRHGLDVCKALAMGAAAVGMAGSFLRLVTDSVDSCLTAVDAWHHQLRVAMTALGVSTVDELRQVPVTVGGETAQWAMQRGIDLKRYAMRGL
ncbi:type 2 isopentenyl-diphosphate Delta-isomerase [Brevibacillus sp. H7]|uniref:type 2 isopentenyl-diphosphate Delta-isomerase n=1 Tax=Brevibacillus sp. H7 TaxID=3349138 RepID=UPI0038285C39